MAKVTVLIASTTQQPVHSGDTFSGYQFQILQGPQVVQTGSAADLSFTFPADVPEGAYTASVVAVNQNGSAMSNAVTADFTVAPATPMFPAPASLTVTVQ